MSTRQKNNTFISMYLGKNVARLADLQKQGGSKTNIETRKANPQDSDPFNTVNLLHK